ncbi:MAG: DUF933 domain-containing protein [Candidatus Omnitrophica bacterium]|nr:DUF933 domain-containing protein [Candidatus Omnitrophota bacterium]
MKIGIIGLPQTGKKTLFGLLTESRHDKDADVKRPLTGIARIREPRLDLLVDVYKPKKYQQARIEVALLETIEKDSISSGKIFKDIFDMDAICHVVRAFGDDTIYHVNGEVNPERDIKTINDELIMHDSIFIEKRLERIENDKTKSNSDILAKEKILLLKLKEHLEKELPLRLFKLEQEEKKILTSYPLLSFKEVVTLLNINENDLKDETLLKKLQNKFASDKQLFMQACLKIEAEIASLDSDQERSEFLRDLGIGESALECLSRISIQALGLISFFTVVSSEVRQWTIKAGSNILDAAGAIHKDMQRGFIRAEIIKFADLKQLGSEEAVKAAGKFCLKGKDYIVEDGDIIKVRFSV